MAISLVKIGDRYNSVNHREYIVDSESDLTNLPTTDECTPGSMAFVTESGSIYILSNSGSWVAMAK